MIYLDFARFQPLMQREPDADVGFEIVYSDDHEIMFTVKQILLMSMTKQ